MKIVLTGASGFLGNEVAQHLETFGAEVYGVDIKAGRHVKSVLDVSSPEFSSLMEVLRPDVIVHLAGVQYLEVISRRSRESFFQTNVSMAQNVAKSMRELQGLQRVVFISSDMVYGHATESPVPTWATVAPLGPYGMSKVLSERVLTLASVNSSVGLTMFRPRLIAGAGRQGTLKELHKLMKRNLPVPVFGKGLNRYQFVAKQDVATAIVLSIAKEISGVYNLGSDHPPQVNELLSRAINDTGSKSQIWHLNRFVSTKVLAGLDRIGLSPLSPEQFEIAGLDCVLDTTATKRDLGWKPTKSDLEMLLESFEYLSSAKS